MDFGEDYFQWDVNDDSLFAEDDDFLALLNNPAAYEAAFAVDSAAFPASAAQGTGQDFGTFCLPVGATLSAGGAAYPAVGSAGAAPSMSGALSAATQPSANAVTAAQAAAAAAAAAAKRKMVVSKNDKRRHYAKMYAEAFNSGDETLLRAFLDKYCTPDCVVIQRCVVNENPFIPKYVEITGLDAIHEFWTQTFLTIPDCLIVMLQTKLRIRNTRPAQNPSSLSSVNGFVVPESGMALNSENGALSSSLLNNQYGMQSNAHDSSNSLNTTSSSSSSSAEASSIVSSFSFTGTKIYTMAMEGAVLHPTHTVTELDSSSANAHLQHTLSLPTISSQSTPQTHALTQGFVPSVPLASSLVTTAPNKSSSANSAAVEPKTKPRGNSRKRALPTDSTESALVSHSLNTQTLTQTQTQVTAESATTGTAADRYNIFLHPPRRFSTLAGTPYGGNASHYTHNTHSAKSRSSNSNAHSSSNHAIAATNESGGVSKISDFVSINAHTKYRPGQLNDKEGVINFLGTLTMSLNAENKISKFEFIYSSFD